MRALMDLSWSQRLMRGRSEGRLRGEFLR